jgi:hypothetical protein
MTVNDIVRISVIWSLPPRNCAEISSFGGNGTRKNIFEVFRLLKPKTKLDLGKDYEQATLGSSALAKLKIKGISEFSCKLVRTLCCDALTATRRRAKRSSQRLLR